MVNVRLRKTISINMQAVKFLDNLEKRCHRFQIRMTEFEYRALEEEAREADQSVAAIIRTRLWPK
jgi:hypothetical protein